ncbi:hypothetical protein VOLCADRAFT_92123 [Volvox carteri f. nagariensis]|uniref:Uncharacterized protein n=1 Tax=Volvox carteri f. nagariensis TaxID=3068 RepID=D8TYN5_VOLCA|nr:uncharacterized protein VOLCADRAFT_92123 [Volvox carteri f. nagariensis]EFJ47343.1 hypothetical protein VOLCADRAFT_92123 [Volvox carteri f. nagariensis]|eukprot:XP_002951532.1 hypothetical protein VOLCADRAFT_92123 [Volvox carteri f. nagariensis]
MHDKSHVFLSERKGRPPGAANEALVKPGSCGRLVPRLAVSQEDERINAVVGCSCWCLPGGLLIPPRLPALAPAAPAPPPWCLARRRWHSITFLSQRLPPPPAALSAPWVYCGRGPYGACFRDAGRPYGP